MFRSDDPLIWRLTLFTLFVLCLGTSLIFQTKYSSSDDEFYFYLYMGSYVTLFIGIGLFVRVFSLIRKRRWVEDIPRSRVKSIAMGLVEVYGVAEKHMNTVEAPHSKIRCLYYKVIKKSEGKKLGERRLGVPFYLRDRTGRVLVDPWRADVRIPRREAFHYSESINTGRGHIVYSYWEYLVVVGKAYYVLGTADKKPHSKASTKGCENIIINKGGAEAPFIISSRPERELVDRMTADIFWGVVGGISLIVASLIYMAWYTNML